MLLRSKLFVPPAGAALVERPRLIEAISASPPGAVVLVVAPAGYGKTTLAAQWLASGAGPGAWLTLDAGDDDARTFARYLSLALAPFAPGLDDVRLLLDRGGPTSPREIASLLLECLHAMPAPCGLVLDDHHALDDGGSAQALLSELIEHLPAALTLVVTSRAVPRWATPQLRATGRLLEIDTGALRFSAREAGDLLRQRGVDAPRPLVDAISERTEGWAVGLALASLVARGAAGLDALAHRFGAADPAVAEYLVQQVLAREPGGVRRALLLSALTPRVSDALLDAIGVAAAGLGVRALHRRGLFLTPLDSEGRWFRYHDLFRELLAREAVATLPDEARDARSRAARWLAAHDAPMEAIELHLAAGGFDEAAALLEAHASERLLVGDFAAVRRFLDAMPAAVRDARPRLLTIDAWTLPDARRARLAPALLDRAAQLLDRARASDGSEPGAAHAALGLPSAETRDQVLAEIAMMRSFFARMRRDFAEATALSTRALDLARGGGIPVRARAATGLGQDALMQGELRLARKQLERALTLALEEGELISIVMSLGYLVHVLEHAGESDFALRTVRRIGAWLEKQKLDRHPLAKWQRGVAASIYLERNQIALSHEVLAPIVALEHGAPLQQIVVLRMRALLACADRDWESAEQAIDDLAAMREALRTEYTFGFPTEAAFRADVALRRGRTERALDWYRAHGASALSSRGYLEETDREIAVRVEVCALDPEVGAAHAERLAADALDGLRIPRAVAALVMAAHAHLRARRLAETRETLERALARAHAHGLHRAVLDAVPDVDPLLRFAAHHGVWPEATARLLAGTSEAREGLRVAVAGLRDPLRPRELQTLKLVHEGLRNHEIAERLGIAPSTVKVHLRKLYGKLGATSRAKALARARELRIPLD